MRWPCLFGRRLLGIHEMEAGCVSWFKVDDGIHDHPKTEHLSLAAVGLWTLAGAYCSRHLTDGAISANRVGKLGGDDDLVRELLDAGLWRVEGRSYIFHDWHDYNPPRAEVEHTEISFVRGCGSR